MCIRLQLASRFLLLFSCLTCTSCSANSAHALSSKLLANPPSNVDNLTQVDCAIGCSSDCVWGVFEGVEDVFCCDISCRAWRVWASTQSTNRRVDGADTRFERGDNVGYCCAECIVELKSTNETREEN